MKRWHQNWVRWLTGALLVVVGMGATVLPATGDTLNWRKAQNRVNADISSWDLNRLLAELAAATDWQIFVEPDARRTVSTKFSDRTTGEALRLLLGDLNFALVPQTNGAARLYVFRTSPQEATRQIHPHSRAKPIPNELIVTLKPGADIDELARLLGAKVSGRVDKLNLYRLEFKDAAAMAAARDYLKQSDDVASVDFNFPLKPQPLPEQLAYSSFPPLNLKPNVTSDGKHIVVGLIDTALDVKDSPYADLLLPSISVAGESPASTTSTALTHGDSMTQTLLRGLSGLADGSEGTQVRIQPVDVYGSSAATTSFQVAEGVYAAINSGATIINLSLGSDGPMDYLHQIIQDAHQQGVLFFAAAGNEPTTTPSFPAAYPEVIAVTAGTSSGDIAPYANRGDFVDAIAPGSMIVKDNQGAMFLVSGTSVSTAYAAGMAAGLTERSGASPQNVEASIRLNLAPKSLAK